MDCGGWSFGVFACHYRGGRGFGAFVTVNCGEQSCEVFGFMSLDTLGTP